ncbi:double-strand break repair protein AddB, partial [Paracoccus onubensis]
MAEWESGLFALPSGVDFAGHFVAGFLRRMEGQPPETIARVTIYANSAQTLAALRHAFDAHGPLLLPRLLTVNDLGAGSALRDGPLAPPLARRLQLAQLIDRLMASRPDLAAGHSISALTQSLASLMAEMQTEGCGPDALEAIDAGDHARHWQNALDFLRIAARFHLDGPVVDRPARQRIAAEIAWNDWSEGRDLPADPVIVAGSTGSHGATRLFMRAVARLPNGAVVLPGFDFDLPPDIWEELSGNSGDHAQFRFAALVEEFGRPRLWSPCDGPSPSRNKLVSLALRPAPVTDQWIAEAPGLPDLPDACEGMTLIEADQPGQEADAIALIMREAAENRQPVTLFAADSGLIRRVVAALDRWRLHANDSSGEPVHLTAPGLFLRHVAAVFGLPLTVDRLLILLKHPLTASGSEVVGLGVARHLARELELHLRAHGPAFPSGDNLRDWGDRGDSMRKSWVLWLASILDRIAGFAEDRAARPLPDRLADLRRLTETLIAGPDGDVAQSES